MVTFHPFSSSMSTRTWTKNLLPFLPLFISIPSCSFAILIIIIISVSFSLSFLSLILISIFMIMLMWNVKWTLLLYSSTSWPGAGRKGRMSNPNGIWMEEGEKKERKKDEEKEKGRRAKEWLKEWIMQIYFLHNHHYHQPLLLSLSLISFFLFLLFFPPLFLSLISFSIFSISLFFSDFSFEWEKKERNLYHCLVWWLWWWSYAQSKTNTFRYKVESKM